MARNSPLVSDLLTTTMMRFDDDLRYSRHGLAHTDTVICTVAQGGEEGHGYGHGHGHGHGYGYGYGIPTRRCCRRRDTHTLTPHTPLADTHTRLLILDKSNYKRKKQSRVRRCRVQLIRIDISSTLARYMHTRIYPHLAMYLCTFRLYGCTSRLYRKVVATVGYSYIQHAYICNIQSQSRTRESLNCSFSFCFYFVLIFYIYLLLYFLFDLILFYISRVRTRIYKYICQKSVDRNCAFCCCCFCFFFFFVCL